MARRVIRDYRKAFPAPSKRAKLMAMPHGSQCNGTALGQPESLVMDQLSSFLAGYDASVLYFFPRGYDHRYWQAFADCNTLIAANEDMVMNGNPLSGVSAVPQSPFPAPAENIEPKFLPDVKKSDLLQIAAFEKDGRILAAVGNFWEKGDVVFKLSVPGLNPAKKYSVREKAFDRQFIKTAGQSFTGKDLADGILPEPCAGSFSKLNRKRNHLPKPLLRRICSVSSNAAAKTISLRRKRKPHGIRLFMRKTTSANSKARVPARFPANR